MNELVKRVRDQIPDDVPDDWSIVLPAGDMRELCNAAEAASLNERRYLRLRDFDMTLEYERYWDDKLNNVMNHRSLDNIIDASIPADAALSGEGVGG